MIKFNEKNILIGNKQIKLEFSIKKVVEFENTVVVLFYDNKIVPNNVVAFDYDGNQLWKVNDILNIKRPTGSVDIKKISDNTLGVYSDLSIEYDIDVNKRELVRKTYLQ